MIWRRIAILVFVALPTLLMVVLYLVGATQDPSVMLGEGSRERMWLCLILPSASLVSYGVGLYAGWRGRLGAWIPRWFALLILVPSLGTFYLYACLLIIFILCAASAGTGSMGSFM